MDEKAKEIGFTVSYIYEDRSSTDYNLSLDEDSILLETGEQYISIQKEVWCKIVDGVSSLLLQRTKENKQ